jgi:electron transport complex protein RnfC
LSNNSFMGGIHPNDYKTASKDLAIEHMPVPTRAVIPVQQHIGAPAKIIVAKGDDVKTGQVIAEAGGFVSVPIHSSITGKVTSIARMAHPVLGRADAIVIEGEGEDEWVELTPVKEEDRTPENIKKAILRAGIAGMGGATFPTHVKLSPPKEKNIDVVILNGAECEPFLTCDHRLMIEESAKIIRGLQYIMQVLEPKKAIIGIEDNKPESIAAMQEQVKDIDNIEVISLPVKYPQGAEKQLIYAAIGRTVPAGKLPMDVGVVVQNVGTAAAVTDAVEEGRPFIDRVLTITGDSVEKSANLNVRIGTLFQDVADYVGGVKEDLGKIIMGGPMMGIAQPNMAVPVIKGTSGILLFNEDMSATPQEAPCINCGRCVDVCPMGLMPTTIAQYVEYEKFDLAEQFNAMDCMECGSCSYVCPSHRFLVQYIRRGKSQIVKNRKKAS